MSTNGAPLTSPRSIDRSRPAEKASSAPTTSWRSTPRSRAKWLRVPAGTHAKGSPCAAAAPATTAMEPSPPAIPSASAPRLTASATSAARSWPGSSTTGSMPRSRARRASDSRTAVPPPERGLMNSTGRCGRRTRRQPIASRNRSAERVLGEAGFMTTSVEAGGATRHVCVIARGRRPAAQIPSRRDGDRREGGPGHGSGDDVSGVVDARVHP